MSLQSVQGFVLLSVQRGEESLQYGSCSCCRDVHAKGHSPAAFTLQLLCWSVYPLHHSTLFTYFTTHFVMHQKRDYKNNSNLSLFEKCLHQCWWFYAFSFTS